MTLEKRVTFGEILIMIGMLASIVIFSVNVGEYKAHLDETLRGVRQMHTELANVEQQSNHVQQQMVEQRASIDNLTTRVKSVEEWIAMVRANQDNHVRAR